MWLRGALIAFQVLDFQLHQKVIEKSAEALMIIIMCVFRFEAIAINSALEPTGKCGVHTHVYIG